MTRPLRAVHVALAAMSLSAIASCTQPPTSNIGPGAEPLPSHPSAVVRTQAAGELPAELQGTWLVRLTRANIRHDLRKAGFGTYADDFLRAERLGRRTTLAVTYDAKSFQIAWLRPDGTWYVGWYGTAREHHGVLTVTDAESHAEDTYGWTVAHDELTLRFRNTTTPDQHGIPFEAYSRAYFTRPMRAADCSPTDLEQCL